MKKLGIDTLKQGLKATIELANKIIECAADGKINLWEKLALLGQSSAFIETVTNAGDIKAEFMDLDVNERAELVSFVRTEFDFDNARIEAIVEESFNTVIALDALIRAIKK